MGPSRKRPRTNAPSDESTSNNTKSKSAADELKSVAVHTPLPETPSNLSSPNPLGDSPPRKTTKAENAGKLNPKASWYGTWPRKSVASTSLAKETICANESTSSATTPLEQSKAPAVINRPPFMTLGKSRETTNITVGGVTDVGSSPSKVSEPFKPPPTTSLTKTREAIAPLDGNQDTPKQKLAQNVGNEDVVGSKEPNMPMRPATSSGWLGGWLGRPVVQPSTSPVQVAGVKQVPEEAHAKDIQVSEVLRDPGSLPTEDKSIPEAPPSPTTASTSKPKSWFGLWSRADVITEPEVEGQAQVPVVATSADENASMQEVIQPSVTKPAPGSSWAFWTSDSNKTDQPTEQPAQTQGELAVAGDTSENKPEPAKTIAPKIDTPPKPNKKNKAPAPDVDKGPQDVASTAETASIKSTASKNPALTKLVPPNLLIPSVRSTYHMLENPSILQQIARLLVKGKQVSTKHLFLAKDRPKIKNALAIGIHGLFPAPLLRTVIGQPTGTSIKFANHAADAIRRWVDENGSKDCKIEKVALEGEGKIDDRVDNLWKLLLNWIEHVRKADFILIGCHSQGVPVAIMLVAKLVEFGVVSFAKIGICAMAGVSLGPFADYKSRLFSGSAGELFDFANPDSAVSKRYEESLRIVLRYGAKVTYCGSIDDQLVSLESSIFSTVSHPHIFRVVFVDGRIHAPDFLAHLVGFALKLRNLGVSDHGLIRELSAPLAGSLYTGEGHSRLYDEIKVYDMATEFTLETTSAREVPLHTTKYEIPTNANPYVLPWIMRGLLEEDFVKTELDAETTKLLKQFDDWKPTTKVLKDVKYRLEAVKSKL